MKQFTHMIALKYIAKVYHLKEAKKGTDEGLKKFPSAFEKETSWQMFEKVLKNNLRSKEGVNSVPLEYRMCINDKPRLAGIVYATEHESLVVMTPLERETFEADNGKVLSVLKD